MAGKKTALLAGAAGLAAVAALALGGTKKAKAAVQALERQIDRRPGESWVAWKARQ